LSPRGELGRQLRSAGVFRHDRLRHGRARDGEFLAPGNPRFRATAARAQRARQSAAHPARREPAQPAFGRPRGQAVGAARADRIAAALGRRPREWPDLGRRDGTALMDPRLLDYYGQELQYIREMGAEFAQEYPKIAARLALSGLECADPYVERLLEGFAFLTARVQLRIDSEFPRFTQQLLNTVYL